MNNYNRYTYKAKRKDNGEWVYGNAIINPNSTDKIVIVESGVTSYSSTKESILEFINDYVEIIPETLCQCTGLQDKDGNYIFENDIVIKNNIEYIVLWWEQAFRYAYYHKEYKDYRQIGDYENCIGEYLKSPKIIGNKFDKEVE